MNLNYSDERKFIQNILQATSVYWAHQKIVKAWSNKMRTEIEKEVAKALVKNFGYHPAFAQTLATHNPSKLQLFPLVNGISVDPKFAPGVPEHNGYSAVSFSFEETPIVAPVFLKFNGYSEKDSLIKINAIAEKIAKQKKFSPMIAEAKLLSKNLQDQEKQLRETLYEERRTKPETFFKKYPELLKHYPLELTKASITLMSNLRALGFDITEKDNKPVLVTKKK